MRTNKKIMKATCMMACVVMALSTHSQTDTLDKDLLLLDEVVVTDYGSRTNIKNASSVTTLKAPADLTVQGAAQTLGMIPGMFVDASAGEVFSRVYTRGVSLSAEDDIGWYYTSLQEDGLPVSAVQFQQFSPDFFLRPDVSHERIEVIRGGKSAILGSNSPGGIVNFISKRPTTAHQNQDRLTVGAYANGRPYGRVEGYSGGPIGSSTWGYDFSYMYRYDRGPRSLDYALNRGGQMKLGFHKSLSNGIISAKIKYLDDNVNRYTGVAATNWNNPEPAFGMSFQNTTLLPPGFENDENQIGNLYNYNPQNGIHAQEIAVQVNADLMFGDWRVTNRGKYSNKGLDWQTAIGGQPLGLDNFLTYFISGDAFPAGLVNFNDVNTGQQVAQVNNTGAFGVFQGLPPSFEYTSGSLPNDAIMASGAWKKDDSIDEWMNELRLQRDFGNVDLTTGIFLSSSEVEVFSNASFIYSTYEPQSRLLEAVLANPGEPERQLSDANGVSNYGGLFYEAADITVGQTALFADGLFNFTEALDVNIGARYERISHSGTKDRSSNSQLEGGLDGNPLTSYDSGPLVMSGEDAIDYNYSFLSFSAAANYALSDQTSIYGRYSRGNKAPELNYYMDNFANQAVNQKAEIQTVTQIEAGLKTNLKNTDIAITAFYSELANVPYTNFVLDDDTQQLFYTPTQLNSATSKGIELNLRQTLTSALDLIAMATIQDARLKEFILYNANETIDVSDDNTVSFDGNKTPHNPDLMFQLGLEYNKADWYGSINYNYMGARYGNNANGFELPAYGTINLGIGYAISARVSAGLRIQNALNTAGLQNFFGPNTFGGNSDAATTEYIAANPNQSFVVFPIMPRAMYFTIEYAITE